MNQRHPFLSLLMMIAFLVAMMMLLSGSMMTCNAFSAPRGPSAIDSFEEEGPAKSLADMDTLFVYSCADLPDEGVQDLVFFSAPGIICEQTKVSSSFSFFMRCVCLWCCG